MLDLSNKSSRRVGMTKNGYPYRQSMLESTPQTNNKARCPTPDIDAPPMDSSDEASMHAEEPASFEGVSKMAEKRKSKRFGSENSNSGNSVRSSPRKRKAQCEPEMEPSTIPMSKFRTSSNSGIGDASRNSQSRDTHVKDENEDDMSGMWDQSQSRKKRKATYGGLSQRSTQDNIHLSSNQNTGKKPIKRRNAAMDMDGIPFRTLEGTEEVIARVSKLKEKNAAKFKKPSAKMTRRETRAQAGSPRSSQGTSQDDQKPILRLPKRLSPKRAANNVGPDASGSLAWQIRDRQHRVDEMEEQSHVSNNVQNAVDLATAKLGLPDLLKKPPSSSKTASSIQTISIDDDSSNSPLSSPPSETTELNPTQRNIKYVNDTILESDQKQLPRCRLCKEEIDKDFHDRHVGKKRLTVREQAQFCKAHKRHHAEVQWDKQRYPIISWEQLNDRLNTYHQAIDDMLQGRRFSFYRNAFEDLVKSRKDRILQKDMMNGEDFEGATPGYYGARGARIMSENIMSRFASKIRRLSASDKLVSSGGVSGYVQAVLVPELAVLLVMDDMRVNQEKAREVIRDSSDIGNLLNEEEHEVIKDPDGDMQAIWSVP